MIEQYLAFKRAQLSQNDSLVERALHAKDPAEAKSILNYLRKDHKQFLPSMTQLMTRTLTCTVKLSPFSKRAFLYNLLGSGSPLHSFLLTPTFWCFQSEGWFSSSQLLLHYKGSFFIPFSLLYFQYRLCDWKFDNALLSDPVFMSEMKNLIQDSTREEMNNPSLMWEWIKFKVWEFSIEYAIRRNREEKKLITDLENRLKFLAEHHNLSDTTDTALESQSIKRELAEIQTNKVNKIIFKAKAKWTCLGEKPSAYFLGLEKRLSKVKCISSLKDGNGKTIMDPSEILAYECAYFSDIYTENPDKLEPIHTLPHTKEDVAQVSASHHFLINLPFTNRDFHDALKGLNKNKSRGSDGITPEFYLDFWDILHQFYFDNIMFSLDQGILSSEQRTGIITLIPKKDQDRTLLNNWRPITLLNTNLKIFSKALSRLQMCIQDIVSPDQTGFIRVRTLGTNVTNIQMIIENTNLTNTNGLLFALDYRKAFDTIRWDLILHSLELFGFGEFTIAAIKVLFNSIKTCVLNSGYSSQYFYPSRGIRQGCCCSPSLFVIAVELLAILVRASTNIRGIPIAGKNIKISQYADDTTFFVNDFPSLDALLHLLSIFAKISGLNINHQKSFPFLLGHHLDPPSQYQEIRIADQVKILGIIFRNDMSADQNYALNFTPKLEKIKSICLTWLHRNLFIKGKVLLISAWMTSVLQYPCTVTSTPTRVIIEFKKLITGFFWNDKRGKVAYNTLVQNIADAGLKLPDLTTRIKITHLYWIKYMWHHPESLMATFLKDILKYDDTHCMIQCKTNFPDASPSSPIFYDMGYATQRGTQRWEADPTRDHLGQWSHQAWSESNLENMERNWNTLYQWLTTRTPAPFSFTHRTREQVRHWRLLFGCSSNPLSHSSSLET